MGQDYHDDGILLKGLHFNFPVTWLDLSVGASQIKFSESQNHFLYSVQGKTSEQILFEGGVQLNFNREGKINPLIKVNVGWGTVSLYTQHVTTSVGNIGYFETGMASARRLSASAGFTTSLSHRLALNASIGYSSLKFVDVNYNAAQNRSRYFRTNDIISFQTGLSYELGYTRTTSAYDNWSRENPKYLFRNYLTFSSLDSKSGVALGYDFSFLIHSSVKTLVGLGLRTKAYSYSSLSSDSTYVIDYSSYADFRLYYGKEIGVIAALELDLLSFLGFGVFDEVKGYRISGNSSVVGYSGNKRELSAGARLTASIPLGKILGLSLYQEFVLNKMFVNHELVFSQSRGFGFVLNF